MKQVSLKLSYIGSKKDSLLAAREVAQELFNEESDYIIDSKERDGYERDIKEIDDVEGMEKLIQDLEEEIIKGKVREAERNCEEKDDLRWWYQSQVL